MRKAFPIIRTQIDDFVRKEQTAMMKKITALLLVLLLLAGCSADRIVNIHVIVPPGTTAVVVLPAGKEKVLPPGSYILP